MLFSLAGQKPEFLLFSAVKLSVFKALHHHLLTQTSTRKHWKTFTPKDSKPIYLQRHMDLYPNDYIKQSTSFMFDVIELEDESAETTINLVLYSLANPKIEYEDNVFKQS